MEIRVYRCNECKRISVTPFQVCSGCGGAGSALDVSVAGTGAVHTFTVIRMAPDSHAHLGTYTLAVIDWDAGFRSLARVRSRQEPQIGARVEAVTSGDGPDGLQVALLPG